MTISGGTLKLDAADDAIHSNKSRGHRWRDDQHQHRGRRRPRRYRAHRERRHDRASPVCTRVSESAAIVVNGGQVSLVASDDGLNAAGGNRWLGHDAGRRRACDGACAPTSSRRPGTTASRSTAEPCQTADGDGIDANGSVTMTNGTVVVQGSMANMNGAIDYDGTFVIRAGRWSRRAARAWRRRRRRPPRRPRCW
ncbi:MAG: carbohydrate-binding domain-containing protein [Dehalococcoidia bacterium]